MPLMQAEWQGVSRAGRPVSLSLGLGQAAPQVPASGTSQEAWGSTQAFTGCQAYLMTVWPVPFGLDAADPTAVLQSLGFFIYGRDDKSDGSSDVTVVYNATGELDSMSADTQGTIILYTQLASWDQSQNKMTWTTPFQVGDVVTGQTSGATGTVAQINDSDPSSGTPTEGAILLGPSSGPFTQGEQFTAPSGASGSVDFQYVLVLSGPAGILGVTSATYLGPATSEELPTTGPCAPARTPIYVPPGGVTTTPPPPVAPPPPVSTGTVTNCPQGQVWDSGWQMCVAPCQPGNAAPTSGNCPAGTCPQGYALQPSGACLSAGGQPPPAPTKPSGGPSAATVVAGVVGVVAVGGALWWILK